MNSEAPSNKEPTDESVKDLAVVRSNHLHDLLDYRRWWNEKLSTASGKLFIFSGVILTILSLFVLPFTIMKSRNSIIWKPANGLTRYEYFSMNGLKEQEYLEVKSKTEKLIELLSEGNAKLTEEDLKKDVLLTPKQLDYIIEIVNQRKNTRKKRKIGNPLNLWIDDKGNPEIIFYKFDSLFENYKRGVVKDQISEITNKTCIQFRELSTLQVFKKPHLLIVSDVWCSSFIGKTGIIEQMISLGGSCTKPGIVLHELMHALGFGHEHQRADRDRYIKILESNIKKGYLMFTKLDHSPTKPYDYSSVLHYQSFIGYGKEMVIETLAEEYQNTIGQRITGSFLDFKQINNLYCKDKCSNAKRTCLYEGYRHPNDCNRCICPIGFTGSDCSEISSKTCGGDLVLTNEKRGSVGLQRAANVINIKSPNYGQGMYTNFKSCSWRIKSPIGTKISLQFHGKFYMYNSVYGATDQSRCIHYVEVQHRLPIGLLGARFCSRIPDSLIISEANEMVIHFWTEVQTRSHSRYGFNATVKAMPYSEGSKVKQSTPAVKVPPTSSLKSGKESPINITALPVEGCSHVIRSYIFCCTFGVAHGRWCGIKQPGSGVDTMDMTLNTAITESDNTGPVAGVGGTGYYVYLEASHKKMADFAVLPLPLGKIEKGPYCLCFSYNAFGHHIGNIYVLRSKPSQPAHVTSEEIMNDRKGQLSQNTIWRFLGDPEKGKSRKWHHIRINVDLNVNSDIAFLVTRNKEFSGDIALDNIYVFNGSC